MWSELCYSFVPSVAGLLSHLGWHLVHDHILIRVKFFGLDLICRQEEFSVAVARIARRVLRCFALDVVRRGHSPTRHRSWIGEGHTVSFEQIGVGWHVAYDRVVVRTLGGLVRVLADFEIEPRRIECAEGETFGIFPRVTIRAILVGNRVTDLAREFVFVQNVLLDVRAAHRIFVTRFACHIGFVPHRRA